MANQEHLDILVKGVGGLNQWRGKNSDRRLDFRGADLRGVNLNGADLRGAELSGAHLGPTMSNVNLSGANLSGASLFGAILHSADLRDVRLNGSTLNNADLTEANLSFANLSGANALMATFLKTSLVGARLRHTQLQWADLTRADLRMADFSGADLGGAGLSSALLGDTTFGDLDLSCIQGLESVKHSGPSTIGLDTIYRSRGQISEVFLRGAGVPENFITYMRSLVGQPLEFYSCFISYSSHDQDFAERLHADLQAKHVRCWFAPEDLKIGDRFLERIEESIRVFDRVLIIMSEASCPFGKAA